MRDILLPLTTEHRVISYSGTSTIYFKEPSWQEGRLHKSLIKICALIWNNLDHYCKVVLEELTIMVLSVYILV